MPILYINCGVTKIVYWEGFVSFFKFNFDNSSLLEIFHAFKVKSRMIFKKSLVVLHCHFLHWPSAYISFAFLISFSKQVDEILL